jgi:hypothetical protein
VCFIDGQRLDGVPRILISDSFHRFRSASERLVYGGCVNWPFARCSLVLAGLPRKNGWKGGTFRCSVRLV